ncbi:hypothetical protein [Brevundimonas sp.]|uniref:hypothetical protein n=1 Tax=Brevundimonas sp. TaxID=1871086 RepID=UPI0019AF85FC|nr:MULTISPECIES: hypothetical protein [Alphaproteobacteria]MBD3805264.1 hypothetical protein [Thioclava sp.]MBD3838024.1 hypothetical protein [Brevundimonas sp.]
MARLSFNLGDLLTPEHIAETIKGAPLILHGSGALKGSFSEIWEKLTPGQRVAAYGGLAYASAALRGEEGVDLPVQLEAMAEALRAERLAQTREDLTAAKEALARAEAALAYFTVSEEVPE